MTAAQQGYSSRYQKIKTNKLRSLSPSHYEETPQLSPSRVQANNNIQSQLGKVVAQISDRVDGIQVKLVNISNIIKLFQKYTETKDIQYEKQKQNDEFRKNIHEKLGSPQSLQIQNKINEIQSLIQRTKAQMTAMQSLRVSIERQNSKKTLCSPEPFQTIHKTLQSPSSNYVHQNSISRQLMEEIEDIMDRMELTLRQEMNKKIDICMTFFRNASQSISSRQSSPSTVNTIMLQQQLHNSTLTMNKIQADCHKNKMLLEAKIEQIVHYIKNLGKNNQQKQWMIAKQKDNYNPQHKLDQSRHSSKSKHSKKSNNERISKSKSKSVEKSNSKRSKNLTDRTDSLHPSKQPSEHSNKIIEQKRKKQIQLKQALRKKKQNREKLKMKS